MLWFNAKNYWKVPKNNEIVQKKTFKGENNYIKFIFINKNTKITNLKKHVCQNAVALALSSYRQYNLPHQIILR